MKKNMKNKCISGEKLNTWLQGRVTGCADVIGVVVECVVQADA